MDKDEDYAAVGDQYLGLNGCWRKMADRNDRAAREVKHPEWLRHVGMAVFLWMEKHTRAAWVLPMILAGATFAHFYNQKPFLEYKNVPFEAETAFVRPGEIAPLHVIRCNNSEIAQTYLIARTLENAADGRQYTLSDSIVQIAPGCHDEISLANRVPSIIPPGKYRILGLSQIQTDFRIHYVSWSSQPFSVVP